MTFINAEERVEIKNIKLFGDSIYSYDTVSTKSVFLITWCSPASESVAQGRSRSEMLPQHPHVSYPCARRAGEHFKRSRRPPGGRSPKLELKKSTNGVTYCSAM